MKIIIINGPNLNLLGTREPEVYGNQNFENYFLELKNKFPAVEIHYFQSNIEGEIINKLQEVGFTFDGIILNAAAYTHTSVGIADAIKAIKTAVRCIFLILFLENLFAINLIFLLLQKELSLVLDFKVMNLLCNLFYKLRKSHTTIFALISFIY